ncbi:MAG TPA: ABC transporter substrate-binding protein [Mycobacteriales bacterium]|jgi:branched-chain amino acid transport system substrate-binding protein|nr:ABC transporter substrate-binding protein [Mycobacteriales bacterium]
MSSLSRPSRHRGRARRRSAVTLAAVVAMLAAAGCGSRESTASIIATERGGGTVVTTAPATTATAPGGVTTTGGTTTGGTVAGGAGGTVTSPTGGRAGNGGTVGGGSSSAPSTTGGTQGGGQTNAGGSTSGSTGATSTPCQTQGSPIKIGEVGAFSGLVGASIPGAHAALPVWVRYINSEGGIACHPVVLYQDDDESNPAISSSDVHTLAQSDHVAAIVGNWVPLDVAGFRQAVESVKIPAVGGDMVTTDWNESPYMYGVGGAARAQFVGSVAGLAKQGLTRIAIFYCIESTACTSYNAALGAQGGAAHNGQKVVYTAATSLTQPDFTSQCENAKKANAQVIVAAGDDSYVQRAARSCAGINYYPVMALSATQGDFDKSDPNMRKDGASLGSAAVPYVLDNTPALQAFHDAMKEYAPTAPVENSAIVTWSDGMMFKAAIDALGPSARTEDITPALVMKGLSKIKNETLGGLIPPTTYGAGGGSSSPSPEILCYYPMLFGHTGEFSAPQGNKYLCFKF